MKIRAAQAGDAEAIAAIQNVVIRDTAVTFNSVERSHEDVVQSICDLPCFLVAEDDGRVLGFASYIQFRRGIGYQRTVEHTIVLCDDARGKGVGRTLMEAVEGHAKSAGVGSIWAGVSAENPAGVAFHARLGYEQIATLPKVGFKFGRWMDLVLMRKWLDETSESRS